MHLAGHMRPAGHVFNTSDVESLCLCHFIKKGNSDRISSEPKFHRQIGKAKII